VHQCIGRGTRQIDAAGNRALEHSFWVVQFALIDQTGAPSKVSRSNPRAGPVIESGRAT
jgi:hypothetical protein